MRAVTSAGDASAPTLLLAANPGPLTGRGNNTWLLDGAEPTLVDAGVGAPAHVDAIADALGGRRLARLLVTHGHSDHVKGRPALVERWPALECWKWPLRTDAADAGWRPLSDGLELAAGDRRLQVVFTPGHAADHVCFWDPPAGVLFVGDMLIRGSSVLIPTAARGGSMRDYLASLARLQTLMPRIAYPGHGNVIDRPRDLMAQYVEHRRAREAQIVAIAADTGPDPDAIVARLYPDLVDDLRRAATVTVEAHLEKLRAEGRLE